MVEGVFAHVTERKHLGMYCRETVSADSGKAHSLYCVKKA